MLGLLCIWHAQSQQEAGKELFRMCSGSYLPEVQDMPACLSEQLDALPVT